MTIQLYTLPNTTSCLVAHHIESDLWEIFPSKQGGYADRRVWDNRPMQKHVRTAHNGTSYIYRAHLGEIPCQARWMGLPEGSTKSIYAQSLTEDTPK